MIKHYNCHLKIHNFCIIHLFRGTLILLSYLILTHFSERHRRGVGKPFLLRGGKKGSKNFHKILYIYCCLANSQLQMLPRPVASWFRFNENYPERSYLLCMQPSLHVTNFEHGLTWDGEWGKEGEVDRGLPPNLITLWYIAGKKLPTGTRYMAVWDSRLI